jgi:hypothetical protein
MLCGQTSCGCAFFSSTLNISVDSNGLVTLEQAEFTDLTGALADIAQLQAEMLAAQSDITALETAMGTAESSIDRLDEMQTGFAAASSGTTSGTTALTIVTDTTPTLAVAGQLFVDGRAIFTKTVSSDVFQLTARINAGSASTPGRDLSGESTGWCTALALTAISAGTSPTVDIQLQRLSGTGTASVASASLRWWYLPN